MAIVDQDRNWIEDGYAGYGLVSLTVSGIPTTDNNASLVLAYTDGNLSSVTKTIAGTAYVRTLTYTDGNLTGVSAWSEV